MDLLRAHVYLALLNGQPVDAPPPGLLPPALARGPGAGLGTDPVPGWADAPTSGPDERHPAADGGPAATVPTPGPDERHSAAGGGPAATQQHLPAGLRGPGPDGPPPAAGLINLTVPLTTLLGLADAPGQAAGHGPLDAAATRLLARALAGHPATRWQITVIGPDGHALAHGTARSSATPAGTRPGTDEPGRGWAIAATAEPITTGACGHRSAEPGYRPSPALQRLIRARTVTCAGPGCRRPAAHCDLDHTIPHDDGGITCECNLGPACPHCHRRKQTQGWTLSQPTPGVMTWTTPAGRRYTTLPSKHPT